MARVSNENINADLARERGRATANVETITNVLDGSETATKKRRDLGKSVQTSLGEVTANG